MTLLPCWPGGERCHLHVQVPWGSLFSPSVEGFLLFWYNFTSADTWVGVGMGNNLHNEENKFLFNSYSHSSYYRTFSALQTVAVGFLLILPDSPYQWLPSAFWCCNKKWEQWSLQKFPPTEKTRVWLARFEEKLLPKFPHKYLGLRANTAGERS